MARISVLDLEGKVQMRWGDDPSGAISSSRRTASPSTRSGNVYVGEVRQAAGADPAGWRKAVRKLGAPGLARARGPLRWRSPGRELRARGPAPGWRTKF